MNTKYLFAAIVAVAAGISAATGCSETDEPDTTSGEEQVRRIAGAVCDSRGNVIFTPTGTEGLYVVPCSDAATARELCMTFTDGKWDGSSSTVTLNDGWGSVHVNSEAGDGIFAEVTFTLVPLPSFDMDEVTINFGLQVTDSAYFDNGNPFIPVLPQYSEWRCSSCGRVFVVPGRNNSPEECSYCHGSGFVKLN